MARIEDHIIDTRDWNILEEEVDLLEDTIPSQEELWEVGRGLASRGCLMRPIDLQNGRKEIISKPKTRKV